MPVAVDGDLMTRGGDLRSQRGKALHLLADEEERRGCSRAREDIENGRSSLRVRSVVEGECHAVVTAQSA